LTQIGAPRETAPQERRIALVPEIAGRLVKTKLDVLVEAGAGAAAGLTDEAYRKAGARIVDARDALSSDVVLKVQAPSAAEIQALKSGSILLSLLPPGTSTAIRGQLRDRKVTAFAMERVPRITRAQSMDVLSSQATVAGYKAVLLGAAAMPRLLPMLTTAAGTIVPAKALILGAGVAGLQAIATARRLGAVVFAFDVRAAVKEQVQSLGARFVEAPSVSAEGSGGYAKELAEEQQRKVLDAIAEPIADMDLVITTAQVPGRPAPKLVTEAMVRRMKPGAVIVDLSTETGGNCELSRMGETVEAHGVTILGPVNLPATVPFHASEMYSRNLFALLQHILKDGQPRIDLTDEIMGAMIVTHAGEDRGA
jgi:NAD(P) transhydrogenase subunit alpha